MDKFELLLNTNSKKLGFNDFLEYMTANWGKTLREMATDLDVSPSTFQKWYAQFAQQAEAKVKERK